MLNLKEAGGDLLVTAPLRMGKMGSLPGYWLIHISFKKNSILNQKEPD